MEASLVEQLPRLSSGVQGLDVILGGGFIEGASYIVQGRPGAGKTILSNQIAFSQAAAARRVLYVTLLAETHDRLFQSLSTLSFFDRAVLGDAITYVSVFQALRDEGLNAVVGLIREETKRQGATLLVFDGLLNARDRAETDLDVKTFVAEIQSQAAFVGCTVLFLTSRREDDSCPEHTMVDGVLDLSDNIAGVRPYRHIQVQKSRGSAALGGRHLFEIGDDGIVIFPRLEAYLSRPTVADDVNPARAPTGIGGLDEIVGGGLPAGSVTLLAGHPGSGKTSFGLSFLHRTPPDQRSLHFGFYETRPRLLAKSRALGMDISGQVPDQIDIVWNPLTENLLDKLAYQLLENIRRRDVKRLFIDGIGGFERASINPARMVEFFAAFTNELRSLGVTTIMTWELRELSSGNAISPLPEISAMLDNLFEIQNIRVNRKLQRRISLLKFRDFPHGDRKFELLIRPQGMAIAELDESAATESPEQAKKG
jgi:circadian clock protein KaiC